LSGKSKSTPKLTAPVEKELEFEIGLNDSDFGKY